MSAAAPPHANLYSQEVLAARAAWARQREADTAAGVSAAAGDAAFDSLRPAQPASAASLAFLAHAAARRLDRWCDPATGGLDANDRADLLRQAEMMGVCPAEAEGVFNGAEDAYRNRPRPVEPQATVRPRRNAWRPRSLVAWALLLACAALATAGMAWLWVAVLMTGE